jgi:hypothetical protein
VVAITEDEIRSLASFRGGDAPVTSCYIDVQGHRAPRHELVREVERWLRHEQARHFDQPSVGADLERILDLVRFGIDRTRTRGLVVFACADADLWRVIELPVPVRNQVTVNHAPAVLQLEHVVDRLERYAVLLVDKQRARVLVYEMGEMVHSEELLDPLPRAEDDDHSYRKERVEHHQTALVRQHLRRAAEVAFELYKDGGFERLILGGPDESVHQLETLLHPYLRERIEARCSIQVGASVEEIRGATEAVEAQLERRRDGEIVARLRQAVGGGRRGAAGLDATL